MSRPGPAATWHLLAVAGALVAAAWLSARPIWHDDNFLHLRTGQLVAASGHVPTTDSFTHTVAGSAWTSHEWGYGLLLHAVHAAFGFAGLVALMPALIVALLAVVYFELRRFVLPARRALCAPLLLLGVAAAEPSCLVLRAALITSLGMALLLSLLRRLREHGSARHVAGVLLVLLLWANMHAGVAFGLFVLGLHALQAAWDQRASGIASLWRAGPTRDRALLLLAGAAITLLNPNGVQLWTFPFRVNQLFYGSGVVYSMGQYGPPRLLIYPAFWALVCVVLAACLPLRRWLQALRSREAPMLAHTLGTLFFLVMAVRSNRFILDFALFALIFVALLWGGRASLVARDPAQQPAQAQTPASPAWVWRMEAASALLVLLVLLVLRPAVPERTIARTTPVAVADFIARAGLRGRMFNYENFGGYLGFRLRQPVYWDGRNDIFFPVAREYVLKRDLGELIDRHRLDMLILNEKDDRAYRPFLTAHRDAWGLVFFDDVASLYLKRVPKFQQALAREYRLLAPFAVPSEPEVQRMLQDERLRRAVEAELAQAVSQSEQSSVAWYLRGRIAEARGDRAGAYRALKRSTALSARPETDFHLGRVALALGKSDEARALVERALTAVP
jgi:hypothetical protein